MGKPFLILEQVFRVKRYLNINLSRGDLFVLNIRLKDSVFVEEIVRFMQALEVQSILIDHQVTVDELSGFLEQLVRPSKRAGQSLTLTDLLKQKNISNIEINSERGYASFENSKQYRGDVHADYSVKSFIFHRLGRSVELLAQIDAFGRTALDEHKIDYVPELVSYVLPEKVASLSADEIRDHLCELVNRVAAESDTAAKDKLIERYRTVFKLADYHHERDKIVEGLDSSFVTSGVVAAGATDAKGKGEDIHAQAGERIDLFLRDMQSGAGAVSHPGEFADCFSRLLRTGQRGKAIQVVSRLMDLLEAPRAQDRQQALLFLDGSLERLDLSADMSICAALTDRVIDRLNNKNETFEYSEVIWILLGKGITSRRYDLVRRITRAMSQRRSFADKVTIYDSMAVKQAFSNINRPETINALIDEMIKSDGETAGFIRDILIAIGSEEVALALSMIISHPVRQIRHQTLKILAELGKASLTVFTGIMKNDDMFVREPDRHELPDSKWYVVRNTIYVLGSLKDPEGITALRLRIDDKDVRVRREIIRSLEKIGGEDACDLLIVMADDHDQEIAEAAVIAAGIIGKEDSAPLFIDVAHRHHALAPRCLFALGKLGGDEATKYLIKLLGSEDELEKLAGEGTTKDDLRLSVVKALGQIGGEAAMKSLKEYRENMSRTEKLFSKNSPVNKVLKEILGT